MPGEAANNWTLARGTVATRPQPLAGPSILRVLLSGHAAQRAWASCLAGRGVRLNVVFDGAAVRLLKRGCRPRLSGLAGGVFTAMAERVMKRQIGWPVPQEPISILEDLGARAHGRPAQTASKLIPAISCGLPVVAAPHSARGLGPPSAHQRRCRKTTRSEWQHRAHHGLPGRTERLWYGKHAEVEPQ